MNNPSSHRPAHLLFLVCIFVSIPLLFCSTPNTPKSEPLTEGWIDDNTYRVYAKGAPVGSLGNQERRRKSAKSEAKKSAQHIIGEQIMGAIREYYSSIMDYCEPSELPAMVKGHINAGSVIDERYDDQDNCTILYEVKSPGFKKLATPPIPCDWGKQKEPM